MIAKFKKNGGGLCVRRKPGESIILSNDVRITIVSIDGNKVRIAIEAPKDMPVHREEVWLEINGLTREDIVS